MVSVSENKIQILEKFFILWSDVGLHFSFQLLKVFSCKEVFEQIFSVISASKFNLQKVLNFISLVCTHYGEKPCLGQYHM